MFLIRRTLAEQPSTICSNKVMSVILFRDVVIDVCWS